MTPGTPPPDHLTPPAALGPGTPMVFCEMHDDRCTEPVTLTAYVVHDPAAGGRVWWARFPDTQQVCTYPIPDDDLHVHLHHFRMAIARYRRWRPAPRKGLYDEDARVDRSAPAPPHDVDGVTPPRVLLLQALDRFWRTFEQAPSNHDLLRMTHFRSTASIGYHLRALEDDGYIEREFGRMRSTRLTDKGRDVVKRANPRTWKDTRYGTQAKLPGLSGRSGTT